MTSTSGITAADSTTGSEATGSSGDTGAESGSTANGSDTEGSEGSESDSTGTAEILCGDGLIAAGELCFESVTIGAVAGGDRGVEVLDVDDDGDLDIVTGTNVALAQGDGTWSVTAPMPGGPFIAAGLLDADGLAEVAIPDEDSLDIHHLDAAGAVVSIDSYAFSGDNGYAAKIGDLVGSPEPDVAVVALSSGTVQVYENMGGVLTPFAPIGLPGFGARHVEIADLDGDGFGDLIIAEEGSSLTVMLGNGAAFGLPVTTATSSLYTTISIGDVNGDSVPDIVGASPTGMFAEIHYGDGDGTLASSQIVPLPVGPRAVGVADLNSDGTADLVAVDYEDTTDLTIVVGEGAQNFADPIVMPFVTFGHDLAIADVNDDGVDDVVVYGQGIGILMSAP